MKVRDLIARLSRLNPELEVTILDGFNGGGQPRTINLGPFEHCRAVGIDDYSDIETEPGRPVAVMGYGCY